jgi:hypothetical protein
MHGGTGTYALCGRVSVAVAVCEGRVTRSELADTVGAVNGPGPVRATAAVVSVTARSGRRPRRSRFGWRRARDRCDPGIIRPRDVHDDGRD